MALAPPVSRNNFHYNGSLYVEVGSLNRHRRATVEEITAILRPDLKKSKKTSLEPPKDQVGHWYEAQLIHYGLPPSKDKSRAKMRLLEALNNSKLNVPSHITQLEAEMKKEYASAERKAKALHKANQVSAKGNEPSTISKKRKQSESSVNANNINVNISLGNGFQGFSEGTHGAASQSPAKRAKNPPSKPVKKKTEETTRPSKRTVDPEVQPLSPDQNLTKRPKQTAKSTKLREAWLKDPTIGPGPVNPAGFNYSMTPSGQFSLADGDLPPSTEPLIEKKPAIKKQPKAKQKVEAGDKMQVKKEGGASKVSKVKTEAKVKEEHDLKASSQIKQEFDNHGPRAPKSPSLGLINGIYDLSCSTVEKEWSCTDLSLILSLDGNFVWGAYDLGMFSGIICLPQRPRQASDELLPFTWRGRENGEGMMTFGHGCEGEISFWGNGYIEGWISVYGRYEFNGFRRSEAGTAVRSARDMRAEWDGYNQRAYDEENRSRWH